MIHLRNKLRRWLRKAVVPLMPKQLRYHVIRQAIRLPATIPHPDLIFKVAQTKEELEQAFRLLHDNYVAAGLMEPHPSGMRLTKYHTLPSTSTLVAVLNKQVLGTVSLIRTNPFGLPCEHLYDLTFLKRKRARIAEISALSIEPSYSNRQGALLWPLIKYMLEYCQNYFGVDEFVIVVHPRWYDFYKAVFFFEDLGKAKNYEFVGGAPGMGGSANFRFSSAYTERFYRNYPASGNVYKYVYENELDNFYFPKRNLLSIDDPVMTPDLLDYFFNQCSSVLADMNDTERFALWQMYTRDDYRKILPKPAAEIWNGRSLRANRFDVSCHGRLAIPGRSDIIVKVKNVSMVGIGCVMHRRLRRGEEYFMEIDLGHGEYAELSVVLAWLKPDGSCGLLISKSSASWASFIDHLDQSRLRKAA